MVETHQVARIMTEHQATSLVRAPTASVSNVLRRISLVVCGLAPDLDEDAERIENQRLILILRRSPTHLRNHIGPLLRFQVYLKYIYLLFHEYIFIIQFCFHFDDDDFFWKRRKKVACFFYDIHWTQLHFNWIKFLFRNRETTDNTIHTPFGKRIGWGLFFIWISKGSRRIIHGGTDISTFICITSRTSSTLDTISQTWTSVAQYCW